MRPVFASVPGKVILMGEHAVVYGRPAVVAAFGARLRVRLSPTAEPTVVLDLPELGHLAETSWEQIAAYADAARERWQAYALAPSPEAFRHVRGDDPAHVVKVALGEVLRVAGGAPAQGAHLRVESAIPVGSGFGSSAAAAVATLAAFTAALELPVDEAMLRRLALEVERRQHGSPSGVDSATVLAGGLLAAQPGPQGLTTSPLAVDPAHLERLAVYDTGEPTEDTGTVVAAVRERRAAEGPAFEARLDRMATATSTFREAIAAGHDAEPVLAAIREFEACLEQLGVVPPPVAALVRHIEDLGGAAKVSGAGALSGQGAGSLLVYHPRAAAVAGAVATAVRPIRAPLGVAGLAVHPLDR